MGFNARKTLHPRNVAMLFLVVAALSLVIAPSVSGSLMRTASAASEHGFQSNLIAKDKVGGNNDNTGGGGGGGTATDNGGSGNAGGGATGGPIIARIIAGPAKQFTLTISANGKLDDGSRARAQITVEGVVDADNNGKIVRVQDDTLTGNAEIRNGMGDIVATLDLSTISLQIVGTKVIVNADFADQDGDTGKLKSTLYSTERINANHSSVNLRGIANTVVIQYESVNQKFTAAGRPNVTGRFDFS